MIQIRDLSKVYPDGRRALRAVSLEFGDGMLGVLGPNGAGKTTMLSILVLTLEPTDGGCLYDGLDPRRSSDRRKILDRVGYLPQDFAPIGRLTGLEYLEHCAGLRGVRLRGSELRRRAHDLLDAVALSAAANRPAGQYSGGMRRRLGLAQALVHAPRLLVVDEPTSGLDPEERIHFRNLITEVAEQTAVLLSTHIVEDIEATCPRLAIIAGGGILFDGEPAELMRRSTGQLWEVSDDGQVCADAERVSRRIDENGACSRILRSETAISGARSVEANLELAYAAFLSRHGFSIDDEADRR